MVRKHRRSMRLLRVRLSRKAAINGPQNKLILYKMLQGLRGGQLMSSRKSRIPPFLSIQRRRPTNIHHRLDRPCLEGIRAVGDADLGGAEEEEIGDGGVETKIASGCKPNIRN
uniref:Uncharacterized protein n=1 Tax=Oryza glumipatula TaxID=40148 RepID=A0A0D9ZJW0_9ORYZ